LPALKLDVENVATPLPFTFPEPSVAPLSLKVTVPVGPAPDPGVTVAVKVTLWPELDGLGEDVRPVVVLAFAIVTFWVFEAALKFVVAAPSACTTQVPAPLELNVAPLTNAQGPLTRL
jgi:hypothetical protein